MLSEGRPGVDNVCSLADGMRNSYLGTLARCVPTWKVLRS